MTATKQIAEAVTASTSTTTSRTETATATIIAIAQRQPAGTRLGTKETLRTECGVSVGTFNEALALAQSRGYVTMKPGPGGGIFVDEQSAIAKLGNAMLALDTAEPSVPDAIRIRDALDPLLIDDAVASAESADIAAMRGQLALMLTALDAGEHLEFTRANWALHRIIAEASPSQMLQSVYLSVLSLLETHAVSVDATADAPLPDYVRSRYDLHVEIVDAIEAKDGERARELIVLHNLNG